MNIPIQCFACTPPTKWATDKEYQDHLVTFHGTASADEAMKLERTKKANTPATLPPGVPPEAAPSEDFVKTMEEIERAKAVQATPPPPAPVTVTPPKIDPIILKYRYEGMHSCGNKVTTLEVDSDNKHFCIAFCLICQAQVEIREVADLNPKKVEKTKEDKK